MILPPTIRTATAADLPALEAISRAAGEAAHWSTAQWEAIFTRTSPRRMVWLTENAAESATGNAAETEAAISRENGGPTGLLVALCGLEWELENIAVLPAARRRGSARALLAEMIEAARAAQAERILLEVRASNAVAIALYEAAGFRELARRRGYYANPTEDALVMVLMLFG